MDREGFYRFLAGLGDLNITLPTVRLPRRWRIRRVRRGAGALSAVGWTLFGGGVLMGVFFLAAALTGGPMREFAALALCGCLSGLPPLLLGARKKNRERRYGRLVNAVGARPWAEITDLANTTGFYYNDTVKALLDMVDRGYFGPDAFVDVVRGVLVVNRGVPVTPRREERTPPPAARPAPAEKPPAPAPEPEKPDEYAALLDQLRDLAERIHNDPLRAKVYRIEAVARATFLAVKEKPEKRPQLQRFMDYYLPTTVKLLNAYVSFERQEVTGQNIEKSKASIERMTDTLAEAFEKQFDSLFFTETIDISTEIKTMDSLLRQDGLLGGMTMPGK